VRTREILCSSLLAFACGRAADASSVTDTAEDGGQRGSDGAAADLDDAASKPGEAGAVGRMDANRDDSPTRSCCVNGAYYGCTTPAALAGCSGFDISSCFQLCTSLDQACVQACGQRASSAHRDPSSCTRDPSMDVLCPDAGAATGAVSWSTSSASPPAAPASDPPAPPPLPKNACGGNFLGFDCAQGVQCASNQHCTQGKCYPSEVGNPCTFANECGDGNHCTRGCCANTAGGSACDTNLDCASGDCTNGTCQ
jgi:hypothetical protein